MTMFRPPKTEETQRFYAGVASGEKHKHHLWGKEARFNSRKVANSPSARLYFTARVASFLRPTDRVIDMGCGPGLFLPSLSPLCGQLVAADVSEDFVRQSVETIREFGLTNTKAVQASAEALPFADGEFDVAIVSDTLHHLYNLKRSIDEVSRIVKRGGLILIFEPNILNPALFLMCLFDRNEWGVFGLCRKAAYAKIFKDRFRIERMEYNGLLIGPDSPLFMRIVNFLNHPRVSPLLGWLNPKIFIVVRNG